MSHRQTGEGMVCRAGPYARDAKGTDPAMTFPSDCPGAGLPPQEIILEAWSILRRAGYLDTATLPYFRSLSRIAVEPADLLRFARRRRRAHRAACPSIYYGLFRLRRPELFDLFALFALGRALSRERFDRALGSSAAAFLESAGFLRRDGDWFRSLVRIYLSRGQVFLHDAPGSDIPLAQRGYMARDSLRFADYLRGELSGRRFGRSLDLGTGCGVQAHILAAVSDEVVAVDQNERALGFARANAAINGVNHVTFLRADLSHAQPGGFDLVVSNPPFLYLPRPLPDGPDPASDGGMLGIGLSRRILGDLIDHLRPGGEARILTSLPGSPEHPILEPWIDRRLLPRGLDVRLRFVEYLWREDQYDAYRARGIRTPALVVAEVRRSDRPRLRVTRPGPAERLILARRLTGLHLTRHGHRAASHLAALRPARVRRILPLALACAFRTVRVRTPPLRLACEPTTSCPLDCISCARAERIPEGRCMDPTAFADVLAAVRPRIVHFHGCGDPLVHPEMDRLCAAARASGAAVALLTSIPQPSMLAVAERCLPHLDRLIIGMDAACPETYGAIRRGGDFNLLLEGLHSLRRTRERADLRRPSIIATFLILESNYAEAAAFVRLAYRSGADAALFVTLDLYSIEARSPRLIGSMQPEKLERALVKAREAAARTGLRTNLDLLLEMPELLRHRYAGEPLRGIGRCLRPWLSTYVTVDGEVRPCSRYAYETTANLGNLFHQSFMGGIWNGSSYRRLRSELKAARPTFPACIGCSVPFEEGGIWTNLHRRRRSP